MVLSNFAQENKLAIVLQQKRVNRQLKEALLTEATESRRTSCLGT